MVRENVDRVREVFGAALDLPPAGRAAFLGRACGGDAALRAEVESLLAANRGAGEFLGQEAPFAAALGQAAGSRTDALLGPYRILRPLGSGGMGSILLAVREDDGVLRRVAVKRMRADVDSEDLLRRFHAERRALAALEHPGIARYLDSGVDAEGRPYLVMDPVDGAPIDEVCRREGLAVTERLRLFCEVCEAVQYAHGRLVVHRDLKPANVLVARGADGRWSPVIVDFGLVKLLDPAEPAAGRTVLAWMTPEYASPEQVRGGAIGTASDVYSLGVLLYELLTGVRPFRLEGKSPAEIERVVCEQDAPPPSSAQGLSPRDRRRLRGDLDNIVVRALRKEPDRRYASAAALAEDIRRHLAGLPVHARPPTATYRLSRFLRRRRWLVSGAVAVLAVGGAGAVGIVRAAERTRVEAGRVERINKFLSELLASVDPAEEGRDVDFTRVLERARDRIEPEFRDDPRVQAALLDTVGVTLHHLERFDEAEPLLRQSLALREKVLGSAHAQTRESLAHLCEMYYDAERFDEAEALAHDLEGRLEVEGVKDTPEVAACLNQLGLIAFDRGSQEKAAGLLGRALEIRRARLGDGHPDTALSYNNLGLVHHAAERWSEAEKCYEKALAIQRAAFGRPHPDLVNTLSNLAQTFGRAGRRAQAWAAAEEALEMSRAVHGPDASDTAWVAASASDAARALGRLDEAEALARDVLRIRLARSPADSAYLAQAQYNLGNVQFDRGDAAGAASSWAAALAAYSTRYSAEHAFARIARVRLAEALCASGRFEEAEEEAARVAMAVEELPAAAAEAEVVLGRCAERCGEVETARGHFERALEIRRDKKADTERWPLDLQAFGEFLLRQGDRDAARAMFEHALALARRHEVDEGPRVSALRRRLEEMEASER